MPKRVDSRARREQIARALWRVTATDGLDAVSLRHVAAEAGVSMGMVQHWFRTKDQMLRFALQTASEHIEARLGQRRTEIEDGSPREAVRALLVELLPLDEQRRLEACVAVAFGARAAVWCRIPLNGPVLWLRHLGERLREGPVGRHPRVDKRAPTVSARR